MVGIEPTTSCPSGRSPQSTPFFLVWWQPLVYESEDIFLPLLLVVNKITISEVREFGADLKTNMAKSHVWISLLNPNSNSKP